MFNQIKCVFCVVTILVSLQAHSQSAGRIAKEPKMEPFVSLLEYPLIKGSKWTGIVPVKKTTDKPDVNKVYKIVFDFTQNGIGKDLTENPNEGLEEVARVLNLHIAAGIKKEHLKATIVVHSGASMSILNNETYFKKFKVNNPNEGLINQLQKAGVKIVLCGQTMNLRGIQENELYKDVFIAVAAKVALVKYQSMGYVLNAISDLH